MKRLIRCSAILALLFVAGSLLAHFSWINPVEEPLQVGETVRIQIGDGHEFPHSEGIMPTGKFEVFAIAPSGATTPLSTGESGDFIAAEYKVAEKGMHRFYFVNDRGVRSRTTRGYRPGGRDKNPKALEAFKDFKSGAAYGLTPEASYEKPKPVGLAFEMIAEVLEDAVVLTVLRSGEPCPGAEVHVGTPEDHHGKALGRTGEDGTFRYVPHHGKKGRTLFLAEYSEEAPEGANYDRANYTAALHLDWR